MMIMMMVMLSSKAYRLVVDFCDSIECQQPEKKNFLIRFVLKSKDHNLIFSIK